MGLKELDVKVPSQHRPPTEKVLGCSPVVASIIIQKDAQRGAVKGSTSHLQVSIVKSLIEDTCLV
jgi:hypothetical protein